MATKKELLDFKLKSNSSNFYEQPKDVVKRLSQGLFDFEKLSVYADLQHFQNYSHSQPQNQP